MVVEASKKTEKRVNLSWVLYSNRDVIGQFERLILSSI